MRIVGGACKKRSLKVPKKGVRPTRGIVRAAIFNILAEMVNEAEVLDLFAGSGALGIEAVSRGAKSCVFVDKNTRLLRENVARLLAGKNTKILAADFRTALRRLKNKNFDVVIADPPYNRKYVQRMLEQINRYHLLKKEGIIVIEHSPDEEFEIPESYSKLKEKRYGDTTVSFITHRRHSS
jgi:16S rRNA (guanine966-N2)-methyltransferase